MMPHGERLLTFIIVAEFSVVFLIVILTCIVRIWFSFSRRSDKKLKKEFETHLQLAIKKDRDIKIGFKRRWRKLELLLSVIKTYDHENTPKWASYKEKFIRPLLRTLARIDANSKNWVKRLYAIRGFSQSAEPSDESSVCRLLFDPIPVVHLEAVQLINHVPTEKVVNALITQMGKERKKSHLFYLTAFIKKPAVMKPIVEERLLKERQPFTRMACYQILLNYHYDLHDRTGHIKNRVQEDILSEHLELSLAAIRLMTSIEGTAAVPFLIKLLTHPQWQKRVVALQLLKGLNATEALTPISHCLHDPEYWVRLNAADTLKAMGHQGFK